MEPVDRFIVANGVRIHFLEWGPTEGVPILFLHGSTGNAHNWDQVAVDLAHDYRVLCLDQRGHGDTEAPADGYRVQDFTQDLDAFVRAANLPPFILMGLSLGSRVATYYGGMRPQNLQAIVLVDPSFDMSEAVQEEFIRNVVTQPESYGSQDEVFKVLRGRASHAYRSDASIRRQIETGMRRRADGRLEWKYNRRAVVASLSHAREDIWFSAANIAVPTLIMRGSASPVATTASVRRMLESIQNSRLCVIERANHGIQQDNPAGFLAAVRPFLEEVLLS